MSYRTELAELQPSGVAEAEGQEQRLVGLGRGLQEQLHAERLGIAVRKRGPATEIPYLTRLSAVGVLISTQK